jgi:hypothetical protein
MPPREHGAHGQQRQHESANQQPPVPRNSHNRSSTTPKLKYINGIDALPA